MSSENSEPKPDLKKLLERLQLQADRDGLVPLSTTSKARLHYHLAELVVLKKKLKRSGSAASQHGSPVTVQDLLDLLDRLSNKQG